MHSGLQGRHCPCPSSHRPLKASWREDEIWGWLVLSFFPLHPLRSTTLAISGSSLSYGWIIIVEIFEHWTIRLQCFGYFSQSNFYFYLCIFFHVPEPLNYRADTRRWSQRVLHSHWNSMKSYATLLVCWIFLIALRFHHSTQRLETLSQLFKVSVWGVQLPFTEKLSEHQWNRQIQKVDWRGERGEERPWDKEKPGEMNLKRKAKRGVKKTEERILSRWKRN